MGEVLDLADLQLLLTAAERGTISAAAQEVGLSLPAASARLSALERRCGMTLLRRHRRGVTLTEDGARVFQDAQRLLAQASRFQDQVSARAQGLRDRVRVALSTSAADALPELLAAALVSMPWLYLELSEMNATAVLEAVRAGEADLGIAAVLEPGVPGCQVQPLWEDPLVVIGAAPPGSGVSMTLAQAMSSPMVGLAPTIPLQRLIDAHAQRAALRPFYRVRLPTLAAVCTVAAAGAGRAIVPRAVARRNNVPATSQVPLEEEWAASQRRAVLAAVDFQHLPVGAATFAQFLLRHRSELSPG